MLGVECVLVFARSYVCCISFHSRCTKVMVVRTSVSTVLSLCMCVCVCVRAPLFLRNSLCCVLISLQDIQRLGVSDSASISAVFFQCVCVCIFAEGITCIARYPQDRQRLGVSGSASISTASFQCVFSFLHIAVHTGCAFFTHHYVCYINKLLNTWILGYDIIFCSPQIRRNTAVPLLPL
jgi:hypothetical protein